MPVVPNTSKKVRLQQEVQGRREDAIQAEQRLRNLSQEATDLPGKLRDAIGEAAKQRAEKARQGESAAHVTADLDIEGLRQRQDQVKLELWAQRIAVEEARIGLYGAEEAQAVEEHKEARARFESIKPRYDEIRQEYEAAQRAASRDPYDSHRTDLVKEARAKLAELEGSYPGA